MLFICEEHGDCIVVFEGSSQRSCPVCMDIENLEGEIEGYKEEVSKLDSQVEDLAAELNELKQREQED